MPYTEFLSPDLLHMNDYSYGCVARALATVIAEDVQSTRKSLEGMHASTSPNVAIPFVDPY
jgi:hypothetical protein